MVMLLATPLTADNRHLNITLVLLQFNLKALYIARRPRTRTAAAGHPKLQPLPVNPLQMSSFELDSSYVRRSMHRRA
jgi:hypothetical protein